MGLVVSKALNPYKSVRENKTNPTSNNSTDALEHSDVLNTPVTLKKSGSIPPSKSPDKHQQTKLLKNLKSDPRSPTIGIYRTPILVYDSDFECQFGNFDSPVSIYSSNVTNSIVHDIMTPLEPPANVSGFDNSRESENNFPAEFQNSVMGSEKSVTLKVKDKPTTYEAKKLLHEINMANENYIKRSCTPTKKSKKKLIVKANSEQTPSHLKGNLPRNRMPLSNITSSGNSPSPLIPSGKLFSRSKTITEFGSENTMSPVGHQVAQWDKNNTVFI